MKILMIGDSPMRKPIFDMIFSCAQMLDTQMHIHVIDPHAEQFCDQCLQKAPLLKETAVITHIPERPECTYELNEKITGKDRNGNPAPFAHLTFETGDVFPSAAKLKAYHPGCVFLFSDYSDKDSMQLLSFAGKGKQPMLIGIDRDTMIGYSRHQQDRKLTEEVHYFPKEQDGKSSKYLSQTEIYQKALQIHMFYEKGNEQRTTRKDMLEKFQNPYNRNSSIRSALAIPYKLRAVGLAEDASEAVYKPNVFGLKVEQSDIQEEQSDIIESTIADRLLDEVLCDEEKVRLLIWLEHRSWQADMIIKGWKLNTDTFASDYERNQFEHRNKKEKWHGCLFGSNVNAEESLDTWSLGDWERKRIDRLDPLDQMAVIMHRRLVKKAESQEKALSDCLKSLKGQIKASVFEQVETAVKNLQANVQNGQILWEQTKKCLLEETKEADELVGYVQCLIKRNEYRRFKESDKDVIEAIPYLLQCSRIRTVYKLCADRQWENVVTSLFVEPEALVLLTDELHPVQKEELDNYNDFLRNCRCLTTVVSCEETKQLRSRRKSAVLDVTGATANQIISIKQNPYLSKLPMITYQNGRLTSPDGSYTQIRAFFHKLFLTVKDTMAITGTKVLSENTDIPMHSMWKYKELWEVVQTTDKYSAVCDYLASKVQQFTVWNSENRWTTDMPRQVAEKFGFIKLLDDMVAQGIIRPYQSHHVIEINKTGLYHSTCAALNKVEQIIMAAEKPTNLAFEIIDKQGQWVIRPERFKIKNIVNKEEPWVAKKEAKTTGLLTLLETLYNNGIIHAFSWDNEKTEIVARQKKWQYSLNKMLDGYVNASDHQRQRMQLRFATEDPSTVCVLEDTGLEFVDVVPLQNDQIEYERADSEKQDKKGKVNRRALRSCLEKLQDKKLITTTGESVFVKRKDKNQYEIKFRYTDMACRTCLTKTGNALEALVYHTCQQMNVFDDVKLGVSILWDKQGIEGKYTTNEIDIICTKGIKSYFISCKNRDEIQNEFLTEIRYEADRFGVDATAILITTAKASKYLSQRARAERMGVEIITLQDYAYRPDMREDSVKELEKQIFKILEQQ